MSYDPRNNNNKCRDRDRDSGYRGEPNGYNWYKRKNKQSTFDSNDFYNRDGLLFDGTGYYRASSYSSSNKFYRRERPSRDRSGYDDGDRLSYGRDRSLYDDRRGSYNRDRSSFSSDGYGSNKDRSSADIKNFHDGDCYGYDRREKRSSYRSRHNNPSRSPSRDRSRDGGDRELDLDKNRESSKDADRDTNIPSRGNIRTNFSIHQGGHLYSDHKAHFPLPHHHHSISDHYAAAYIKREETPIRSRWDLRPVNTSQTALHQYRSDGSSSSHQSPLPSLSPTTDMFRLPSVSTPETALPRSFTNQSPPLPATLMSGSISLSTATSAMTTTSQDGITNHFQHSHLITHSTVVHDHPQPENVQTQVPPQDHRSMLVSAAAEACKALHNFRKQTGLPTSDISVADVMGKRHVGRPSKVRLETEDAALLGIKYFSSEMEELAQSPAQRHGVASETEVVRMQRRINTNKVDTPGYTARLSVAATATTSSICHRQHPIQGHRQQEPQPMRILKTRREWESQRQGIPGRGKPAIEAPQRLSRQVLAPPVNPFLRKVIDKTNEPVHLLVKTDADRVKETQSDEIEEGYLGSPYLEREYCKKADDTPVSQITTKKNTPSQPEANSTPPPVASKHGGQLISRQRESIHSNDIVKIHHADGSETRMRSNTNKATFTMFSRPVKSSRSPPESVPAQDRYNMLFLRKKAAGRERSCIGQQKQVGPIPYRQTPFDDSDASIGPHPSTMKSTLSLSQSKKRRRITFADFKPEDKLVSHDSQDDATNLSATLPLDAEVSDAQEPSHSASPSPLLLTSLSLSPLPSAQEEADLDDDISDQGYANNRIYTNCV
ncbi:hypothetical protein BG015_009920 [Linnemannia schmuckeri]|uniref:Uncharacterized protein n=1 Tax=Linnemannia schmuckeri TaxID=64567 RepID=A0A9P5V901_9FUNG|nr:hypothetical protein BG015_009920 [Linnemannia schmuckeri]